MSAAPSEPTTDGVEALVLRAAERALQLRTSRASVKIAADDVAAELTPREDGKRWTSMVEQCRGALSELHRRKLLARHVNPSNRAVSYTVTDAGRAELDALRAAGSARLPETQAHRVWRERRDLAAADVDAIRGRIHASLRQIAAAVDGDDPQALEHPDADDPRTIAGIVEDDLDLLQSALRLAVAPEPDDPR